MGRHSILISIMMLVSCQTGAEILQRDPIVKMRCGAVQGNTMVTRLGVEHYAFRGIAYAQPPIGPLRFKAPDSVEPWDGVRNATIDGPMCPQAVTNAGQPMSEDCLFLNVYTRHLPAKDERDDAKNHRKWKSVIVYIHPGGFISGSSGSNTGAGPQYMMDRDIVLVTFNYRLGALGFLSTGTCDSPGNYGLLDQVLVLEWVRDNIKCFGGNPDSVTLLGYSSGAMSVTLHMVSPLSQDLFHKAIVMSGSLVGQFDVPYNQIDLAIRQAKIFNCPTNSFPDMIECLRGVDAIALGKSTTQMAEFVCPLLLNLPVVERHCCQRRFLTDQPEKLFRLGKFPKVPVIAGVTEFEYLLNTMIILLMPDAVQRLNTDFPNLAPVCLWYEQGKQRSIRAPNVFRSTLPDQIENNNASITALEELLTDSTIAYPMHRFVELVSRRTTVYYYASTFVNQFSFLGKTVHGSDLICLFAPATAVPRIGQNDNYTLYIERFTRLWAGFASNGAPYLPTDPFLNGLRWTPTTRRNFEYLDIGNELTIKENFHGERYAVWDQLFPPSKR